MSDIPKDIWESAGQALAGNFEDGYPTLPLSEMVAKAIMEERERCAKIAESVIESSDGYNGAYDASKEILDRIRGTS